MFNKNKTFNFSEQEISGLRELDSYIVMRNAEVQMGKNMYGNVVDAALKRCGYDPKKLMEEGKRLDIDLNKGVFTIIEPEKKPETQNKPPVKDSTASK